MAIIPGVPGLKVEIRVDNKPLAEYASEDVEDDAKTITRYIEARSGAKFTVRWTYYSNFKYADWDDCARLHVDGRYVTGRVTYSKELRGKASCSKIIEATRSFEKGKYFQRELIFSQVNVDEDNTHASTSRHTDSLKELGEISFRFNHGTALHTIDRSGLESFSPLEKVSEKALKGRAVSHQLKLGDAVPIPKYDKVEFKEKDKNPYAIFRFLYRSREALKSEYIIPRSPTPVSLEERPVEELTAEELREIVRRQRVERDAARQTPKQESKREIKRERRPSEASIVSLPGSEDSDLEITNMRSSKRRRTSGPVEVIDLCDD